MKNLKEFRARLDKIDEQLQDLLNQRASIALEIGKEKCKDKSPVFYCPEREAEILEAVVKRNKGPISDTDLLDIYKKIMAVCLALQSHQT